MDREMKGVAMLCERIDGLIFDLDGTLVDSLPGLLFALEETFESPGYCSLEEVQAWVGDGAGALVQRAWAARREGDPPAGTVQRFEDLLVASGTSGATVYPGVREMLEELAEGGWKVAVLTNKPERAAQELVAALFEPGLVQVVQGVAGDGLKKPDPGTALRVMAGLGVSPSRTVMVGDSPGDMVTAKRAGIVAIGVAWGYRSVALLVEGGADRIVDRPADLVAWLRVVNGIKC